MRRPRRNEMRTVHVHVNYVQLSLHPGCQPLGGKKKLLLRGGEGKKTETAQTYQEKQMREPFSPGEPDKGESAAAALASPGRSPSLRRGDSGLTAFCPSRFARLFFSSALSLLISTAVGGAEHRQPRKRQSGHVQRWHGVCNAMPVASGAFCGRTDRLVLLRLRLRHLIAAAGSQTR